MARKVWGIIGIFVAVVFLTGGHCGNEITGPLATATPVPATETPAPTSSPTPHGPTNTPAPPTATLPPTATFTPAPPTATFTPAPPTGTFTPAPPTSTPLPATATPPPPTSTPGPPTATPVPGAPTVDGFESNPPAHPGDVFDITGTNVDSTSCHSSWFLKNSGGTQYPLTCQFGSDIDAQLQVPLSTPTGTYVICVHRTDGQQACSSFTVTLS
jgi:hypothetical protein